MKEANEQCHIETDNKIYSSVLISTGSEKTVY